MKKYLMPYVARAISSDAVLHLKRFIQERKRRLTGQPHTLDVFIKVDDPYSFLLIQVLRAFLTRFDVEVRFHTVLALQEDMYPEAAMWYQYAVHDALQLARLYELDFLPTDPLDDQERIEQATALLLHAENTKDYLSVAHNVLHALWFQEALPDVPPNVDSHASHAQRKANENRLKDMGHYLGATVHYNGEWYWGIDRLDHLEMRLITLNAAYNASDTVRYNRTYHPFCQGTSSDIARKSLTLYWSARSPYSYLALERTIQLSEHYHLPLHIKPVLPMVMRGMTVPNTKKMYIFLDTKREGKKLGIDYGFVADPLGDAVKRCYALYEYAQQEGKGNAFLLSFARAVNAQGVHADTDKGMQYIVERCGLEWAKAKPLLHHTHWESWAQQNLDDMMAMGCWGVPSLQYTEMHVWGQDRICIIEQAIQHQDTG